MSEEGLRAAVLAETPAVEREGIVERGRRIAERLNRARAGPPLEVIVVKVDLSSFTLAPGPIYVGRRWMEPWVNDAAAAFVMAHEMAHRDLGHARPVEAGTLHEIASRHALTADQELAADRAAIELCRRADFAGAGAHEAFEILAWFENEIRERERQRALPGAVGIVEHLVANLASARKAAPIEDRRRALWGLERRESVTEVVAKGLASTGMTTACLSCRSRFAPRGGCPRCLGWGELVDLRDPAARARLAVKPSVWWDWKRVLSYSLMLAVPATLWSLFGASSLLLALFIIGVLYAFELGRHPARAGTAATRGREVEPIAVSRLLGGRGAVEVQGVVRAIRTTVSPLGTTCLAWRVVGTALDDAGVGAFEIMQGDRLVGRVVTDDALVDLAGPPTPAAMRVLDDRLWIFLSERGQRTDGDRALAEHVLTEGEVAVVSGAADEEVVSDGLRGAQAVPVFRDWPVIRKG